VRRFSALFILASACSSRPSSPAASANARPNPPPAPELAQERVDTLGVVIAPLEPPVSEASARFVSPSSGERVALSAARAYDVRWSIEHLDSDALGIDVALDAFRSRRLPASSSGLTLGLLVPAGEQLAAGTHWLFVAPISASGLVPRRSPAAPATAVAVRFQLGDLPVDPASARGAIWLRKPEGTLNGPSAEHVLFDVQPFAENGAPLAGPCRLVVRGPLSGELDLDGPISALSLAAGDYELSASAAGAAPAAARLITVNPELGRPK